MRRPYLPLTQIIDEDYDVNNIDSLLENKQYKSAIDLVKSASDQEDQLNLIDSVCLTMSLSMSLPRSDSNKNPHDIILFELCSGNSFDKELLKKFLDKLINLQDGVEEDFFHSTFSLFNCCNFIIDLVENGYISRAKEIMAMDHFKNQELSFSNPYNISVTNWDFIYYLVENKNLSPQSAFELAVRYNNNDKQSIKYLALGAFITNELIGYYYDDYHFNTKIVEQSAMYFTNYDKQNNNQFLPLELAKSIYHIQTDLNLEKILIGDQYLLALDNQNNNLQAFEIEKLINISKYIPLPHRKSHIEQNGEKEKQIAYVADMKKLLAIKKNILGKKNNNDNNNDDNTNDKNDDNNSKANQYDSQDIEYIFAINRDIKSFFNLIEFFKALDKINKDAGLEVALLPVLENLIGEFIFTLPKNIDIDEKNNAKFIEAIRNERFGDCETAVQDKILSDVTNMIAKLKYNNDDDDIPNVNNINNLNSTPPLKKRRLNEKNENEINY